MTTADLNNKFKNKLDNKKWTLDNSAGLHRVVDAARSMPNSEAEKWLADDAKRGGRCALFTAAFVGVVTLVIYLAGVLS